VVFLITQVALCAGPEADNKMKLACEPLKHRFLDHSKVAFWDYQEAENDF